MIKGRNIDMPLVLDSRENVGALKDNADKSCQWDGADLFEVKGMVKFKNRGGVMTGTTDTFAQQIRYEPTTVDDINIGLDSTCDARASFTTGALRAVQGVARVTSTFTFSSSASLIGVYSQIANSGTVNGSGVFAGFYGLIEAGGTWTAVNRLTNMWLDNHLVAAPGSGEVSFISLTNNAAMQYGEAFHVYGGLKVSKLFTFTTCTGSTGFVKPSGTAHSATKIGELLVDIDGTAGYIKVFAVA